MKLHHLAVVLCANIVTTAALADSMHNYPPKETARAESVETVQSAHVWQPPVAQAAPAGKTRRQVVEELKQAEREGLVPTSDNDYPPSNWRIEINKEKYAARHHAAQAK
ncbi:MULTISPECIES: DUF4148 domain-containing protein [Caballeronia]|uniref:DUF4148 domain-containing protein n=1 Tax=Caballeronia novacaledonica TaxID=1544861 RepID=A0AA37IG64_9BURK|nr:MULTISPECIES: DUF4148 domain-containing protein [Caballeronia]MDR5743536.1 DUF4148 domain-containing protein [Caballeronia sp. LZ029]GJH28597.1 DUF4148 domain-containing protein [Caballeronia novacaledonica]